MNRTGERWCGEDWPRVFCGLSVPAVTLLVMPRVMAVAFEQYGRLHYLDPGGVDYHVGDWVLYPTDDGAEVARVVWAPEETTLEAPLPRCLGRATKADLRRDETNREHRRRIHEVAVERIAAHGLPLPEGCYMPETLEEQLICYADKFFSKTKLGPRAGWTSAP